MHELSLAMALMDQVRAIAAREGAARVTRVAVSVGALAGVDRDAFEFAFECAAEDGPARGAALEYTAVPLTVRCRACGRDSFPEALFVRCGSCGGADVEITGGRDFRLESLDVETDNESETGHV